jgi:pyruvate formate lyase activating enzyme
MSQPVIRTEEVLRYLEKRKGILDGVCVTGGEPTLDADLKPLLKEIKALGYLIKLDTNGSRPDVLRDLAENRLIDMAAMDIKASPEQYAAAAGIPGLDLIPIGDSVQYLLRGKLPYEFRTTVVKELHDRSTFVSIGKWIAGASAYYLQAFRDSENVMVDGFHSYSCQELVEFRRLLEETIPKVGIRGID